MSYLLQFMLQIGLFLCIINYVVMLVIHFIKLYFRGPKDGLEEEGHFIMDTINPALGHEWVDDINQLETPDFKIVDYSVAYVH